MCLLPVLGEAWAPPAVALQSRPTLAEPLTMPKPSSASLRRASCSERRGRVPGVNGGALHVGLSVADCCLCCGSAAHGSGAGPAVVGSVCARGTEPDETADLERRERPEQEPWPCRPVATTASPSTAGITARAASLVPQRHGAVAWMGEETLLPSSCAGGGHWAAGNRAPPCRGGSLAKRLRSGADLPLLSLPALGWRGCPQAPFL